MLLCLLLLVGVVAGCCVVVFVDGSGHGGDGGITADLNEKMERELVMCKCNCSESAIATVREGGSYI